MSFFVQIFQFSDIIFPIYNDPGKGDPEDIMFELISILVKSFQKEKHFHDGNDIDTLITVHKIRN